MGAPNFYMTLNMTLTLKFKVRVYAHVLSQQGRFAPLLYKGASRPYFCNEEQIERRLPTDTTALISKPHKAAVSNNLWLRNYCTGGGRGAEARRQPRYANRAAPA